MRLDQCPGMRAAVRASAREFKPDSSGSTIGEGPWKACDVIENGYVCPVIAKALSDDNGGVVMLTHQHTESALCQLDASVPKQESFL